MGYTIIIFILPNDVLQRPYSHYGMRVEERMWRTDVGRRRGWVSNHDRFGYTTGNWAARGYDGTWAYENKKR